MLYTQWVYSRVAPASSLWAPRSADRLDDLPKGLWSGAGRAARQVAKPTPQPGGSCISPALDHVGPATKALIP